MNLLSILIQQPSWLVSPDTTIQTQLHMRDSIMWSIEVNDPIGGRGAMLSIKFADRHTAEAIAKALNSGKTPHELGFSVKHLTDQ